MLFCRKALPVIQQSHLHCKEQYSLSHYAEGWNPSFTYENPLKEKLKASLSWTKAGLRRQSYWSLSLWKFQRLVILQNPLIRDLFFQQGHPQLPLFIGKLCIAAAFAWKETHLHNSFHKLLPVIFSLPLSLSETGKTPQRQLCHHMLSFLKPNNIVDFVNNNILSWPSQENFINTI